jgi:drug/metabolite transporter (DMT)-like permease
MAPARTPSGRRAQLLLLLAVVFWSTTFIIMKVQLTSISPALMVFVRFALATVIVYALFRHRIAFTWANLGKGVLIGIPEFIGFMLQTTGLMTTTASKSAFITGLCVVIAPALSFVFLREAKSVKTFAALLLAVVGLWTISFGFTLRIVRLGTGDMLTLLSAIAFSVQIFMIHRFSKRDSFHAMTFFQLLVVAVCSLVYLVSSHEGMVVNTSSWPWLVYLAIFTTVLTLLLQNRFQHEVTVAQAGIIYSLEPVLASVLAVVLISEQMGPASLVGGALIVLASAIS